MAKLPLYTSAAIAAIALGFIGDARGWSTGELFIALIVVVPLYVGLIAVPWLL